MLKNLIISFVMMGCLFSASGFAEESAKFVGSKNSKKFHYSWCKSARKINPKNLVEFKTAKEAVEAGRTPCKVCKPLSSE